MLTFRVPVLPDEVLKGDGSDLAEPQVQAVLHSHPQQVHQLPLNMLELHNCTRNHQIKICFIGTFTAAFAAEHFVKSSSRVTDICNNHNVELKASKSDIHQL